MKIMERVQRLKKNYTKISNVINKKGLRIDWYDMLINLDSPTYAHNPQDVMVLFSECRSELLEFDLDMKALHSQIGSLECELSFVVSLLFDLGIGSMPLPMDIEQIERSIDKVRRELDV